MPHLRRHRFDIRAPELMLGGLGVLLIGWWVFSVAAAHVYQSEAARTLAMLRSSTPGPEQASPSRSLGALRKRAARGAPVGRLEIPAAGVSAMVAEGIDSGTLRRAVGHDPSSALPGRPGRSILAAHRDGFFKHLDRVRPGDRITIETPRGDVAYRVRSTAIVRPSDTHALRQGSPSGLTLVTCYPFQFLGSAPLRYIVRADRIEGAMAARPAPPIARHRVAAAMVSHAVTRTSHRVAAPAR